MKFLIFCFVMLLVSCSFKSKTDAQPESAGDGQHEVLEAKLNPNADSDGDFVKNVDELSSGRSPMVANMPELSIHFLQNYKITADAKSVSSGEIKKIVIDTKIGRNNPNFKYRVGELFVSSHAQRVAASVSRFSSHSTGEIEAHDLSWVKYPDVDPAFYSQQVLWYKKYFDSPDFEIENIKITLENTVKLKGNEHYKTVKNLKLNFYFYNYETQNYEVIGAKVVTRHFEAGVVETFEVELDNVPAQLIEDNYFKKGEFIISEVADYEIPELNSTYETLVRSVKSKCLPVIVTTPLSTSTSYVSVDGGPKSSTFSHLLSHLYDKGVKIENDKLEKINEFENNLPNFTYLKEVAALDKVGKWFVLTRPMKENYLDHQFTQADVIVLSYVTGQSLASQSVEKIYSYEENLSTLDTFTLTPLGAVSENSIIEFQLAPIKKIGEDLGSFQDAWVSAGGSCGQNCVRSEFDCRISINLFKPIEPGFSLSPELPEFKRMFLIVDQQEFSLYQLWKDKQIEIQNLHSSIHIKIPDINKIKEIAPTDEANLSFKITAFKDTVFHGVKLNSFTGRNRADCLPLLTNFAGPRGFPISVESAEFEGWRGGVNWNAIKLGENKTYFQGMEVAVTSVINNFYN
ncbi:MAG: hypothetical protein HYV97_18810 [Bdellovibrio sp.]|nr:hypothetical protein [Bdellovibrio sp.]